MCVCGSGGRDGLVVLQRLSAKTSSVQQQPVSRSPPPPTLRLFLLQTEEVQRPRYQDQHLDLHLQCEVSSLTPPFLSYPVCPASSAAPQPRRSQMAASPEGEVQQEVGGHNRKSSPMEGGSPLLGNANNPNMADIPEHKKELATPTVSLPVGIQVVLQYK